MPFYNFFCEDCNLEYEDFVPYSEYDPNYPCPDCSGPGERIWDGCAAIKVQGGTPKFYGNYQDLKKTEERWLDKEIDNTKRHIAAKTGGKSPYSTMFLEPEYFKTKYGAKDRSKEDIAKIQDANKKALKPIQDRTKNIDD